MEAEEAEADGARRPRARQRITRVNQSPFRFSIVQTALQTNFDVHRQCLKNVDLPPPRKPSFTLISCPLTKCLSFPPLHGSECQVTTKLLNHKFFSTTRFFSQKKEEGSLIRDRILV